MNYPKLKHSEIHIWYVSTDITAEKEKEYTTKLSEFELSRLQYFKTENARIAYLVSQAALRIILSNYLKIPSKNIKIGRHKKGKPFSMDDPGLFFNLSNSGEMAVVAVTRDSEIGIDIEKLRLLPDLEEMIKTNFTSNEISYINKSSEEKERRFFRLWTMKESYLKAIGEGMRLAPENIEFSVNNNSVQLLSVKGVFEQEDWNFKEFSILANYVGTLTYKNPNALIKLCELK